MKLCPVAVVVGCKKCPVFKICPLKGVIGDAPPAVEAAPPAKPKSATRTKPRNAAKRRTAATKKK